MCAIVDANVVSEILEDSDSEPGQAFRRWLRSSRHGSLVIGGKLIDELMPKASDGKEKRTKVGIFLRELEQMGRLKQEDDSKVKSLTEELKSQSRGGFCPCPLTHNHVIHSDDHHIIALARISGARLLYSNDKALHKDFKNKCLIKNPNGTVYSTLFNQSLSSYRKRQLDQHRCI